MSKRVNGIFRCWFIQNLMRTKCNFKYQVREYADLMIPRGLVALWYCCDEMATKMLSELHFHFEVLTENIAVLKSWEVLCLLFGNDKQNLNLACKYQVRHYVMWAFKWKKKCHDFNQILPLQWAKSFIFVSRLWFGRFHLLLVISRELRRHLWKKQAVLGWKKEVSQHWYNHCTELCLPRTSKSLPYHFCTWSRTQLWLPGEFLRCATLMHGEREFNKLLHFVPFSFNLRFFFIFFFIPSHSQHDSGSECTPGESKSQDKKEKGNYIMYARATSGDKLNNNKFSICSVRNISQVLEKKRSNCFVGTFCWFCQTHTSHSSHSFIVILLFSDCESFEPKTLH